MTTGDMNLEALAAMDDCEHATGLPIEEHKRRRTPKEIIGADALFRLRDAGYMVVQVVQTGNRHI